MRVQGHSGYTIFTRNFSLARGWLGCCILAPGGGWGLGGMDLAHTY